MKSVLMRWLREPVLHFVVAGALLFSAFTVFKGGGQATGAETIVVDRRALLTFLQYRANAFEPETFGAALDAMSDQELDELIDAYVNEEILYREARELGLEESDNIIRQRMVQKMRFLLEDLAAADRAEDLESLETYFAENIEAYAIQPWATFTHVFFDAQKRGAEGARLAAENAKRELNERGAGFNDAVGMGDNFPYLRNYVERTIEYIAGHFGYEFVSQIENLEPSDDEWQGPFASVYGEHIVLLTERAERAYPALADVKGTVERDLATELANEALADMTRRMRERYDIRVDEIRSGPDARAPE